MQRAATIAPRIWPIESLMKTPRAASRCASTSSSRWRMSARRAMSSMFVRCACSRSAIATIRSASPGDNWSYWKSSSGAGSGPSRICVTTVVCRVGCAGWFCARRTPRCVRGGLLTVLRAILRCGFAQRVPDPHPVRRNAASPCRKRLKAPRLRLRRKRVIGVQHQGRSQSARYAVPESAAAVVGGVNRM